MGLMKRREFLSLAALGAGATAYQDDIRIEVIEVFSSLTGPSALLVHHADEATREVFADWLRQNSGREIVLHSGDNTSRDARIFRTRLCFGRGLILLNTPASGVQAKDLLRVNLRRVQ